MFATILGLNTSPASFSLANGTPFESHSLGRLRECGMVI